MHIRKGIFLALFINTMVTYAVISDNSKPIVITSDSLQGDLTQHVAIFQGRVAAIQGTRELHSDVGYVYFNEQGQVNQIKATGTPAKTTEILDSQGNRVYGQALTIEYFPLKDFIQYEEEAMLEEHGNIFKGNLITYNIANQIVASPETKSNTGAATIILPPSTLIKS
jgi:lipopolysaccharide export system protein LptA